MKLIKISLVIVVIGLISFFVLKSCYSDKGRKVEDDIKTVNPAENIKKDINNLSRLTDFVSCKNKYYEIKLSIEDNYNFKDIDKNQFENLSKQLYAAYVTKFLNYSYSIFNKQEWRINDLNIIRNESNILKNNSFLEKENSVYIKFTEIEQVFKKYDEINNFISECNSYSYSDYGLDSGFPINNVKNKILKASSYKTNNLNNKYVNNCSRLHIKLNEIPSTLFNKHYTYLKNKFKLKTENNSRKEYKQYTSFNIYRTIFNTPAITELGLLNKSLYNVNQFDSKYKELKKILDEDYKTAYIKI
jgi:hypothetical protein